MDFLMSVGFMDYSGYPTLLFHIGSKTKAFEDSFGSFGMEQIHQYQSIHCSILATGYWVHRINIL